MAALIWQRNVQTPAAKVVADFLGPVVSDWTLPPNSALIVGMTGSGKTTFALRALINVPAACKFVFDDMGQASARLRIPQAATAEELKASLSGNWCLFNPHRMFPGELDRAFKFFCEWTFEMCRLSGHKKILLVDEVWRFQTPHGIPRELALCSQAGRGENLHLITATQLPHKIHASLTGQATEVVFFRLDEPLALERCREFGIDPERVRALPMGTWIAKNRLSGVEMTGRVF